MDTENKELTFFFQPLSELTFSEKSPVMAIVFEEKEDPAVKKYLPEVEELRQRTDKITYKTAETVMLTVLRKDRLCSAGMIYVPYPRKRNRWERNWSDLNSINFHRKVSMKIAEMVSHLRERRFTEAIILLPSEFHPGNIQNKNQRRQLEMIIQTVVESVVHANNTLDDFMTEKKPKLRSVTLTYLGEYSQSINGFFQRAIGLGEDIGMGLAYARRLIELPPNVSFPKLLAEEATGAKLNIRSTKSKEWHDIKSTPTRPLKFSSKVRISILYGNEGIAKFGFGLVAAVAQGSKHEPVFMKLHYKPQTKRKKPLKRIVLTGKAVTFDTGGIDIKLTGSYTNMHYDMGGGAVVLAAIKIADARNLPVEIIGLIPMVENAIGPEATRPGDIVRAFDGTTVEITNTDSEGRLILGDAVAYAEARLRPDCIISVATLCTIGDIAPDILKVLCTSERLEKKVRIAEKRSAEKVIIWPCPEHLIEVGNELVGNPRSDLVNEIDSAYHSAGPLFVHQFLKHEDSQWIFVDVSAIFETNAGDYGAGPGFGVRFLWQLLRQFT